ncbi:MAG TPA: FAD-dependent oxidoreductase [Vicinamibacterales bacterium]|nr:FAD-dependent oxidoreductase [Vicinamibacterales bacterium]
MTKYGRSPWIELAPKSRVPSYPQQRGPLETSVVVVGGGLTGCATAYAFAAAGVNAVLVEASRIGRGGTGLATGWIAGDPGVSFVEVDRSLGRAAARHAFRAWRRAALDLTALVRRLGIPCDLRAGSTATVALTPDQATRLRREQKIRRDAGLEAPLLNARAVRAELALDGVAAIREHASGVVDPYRACLGLAAAAAARGVRIFEKSEVRKISFTRRIVDVITAGGSIRANRVVVATGFPTALFKSLRRHFWFRTAYLAMSDRVPAVIRKQLGRRDAIVRDLASPPHVVRWVGDDRLLVGGADLETPPDRQRERIIPQRTGQLMYELSTLYPDISGILPQYGWDAPYARTSDGLPYIGPHRNFPHHLFAFGDSSHSVTGAFLASRALLRHHLDELEPVDRFFSFTRHGD